MKKYLLFVLIVFLFSCSEDNKDEEIIIKDPVGFYQIDVKTNWLDKADLQGIKSGILNYIRYSSTWCEDVNLGEEFEVWIDNIGREEVSPNRWKIKVDLIIKESTTFGANERINERMEIYFDVPENLDEILLSTEKSKLFINASLELSNSLSAFNISFTAVSSSLYFIQNLLNIFEDEKLNNVRKAEALVTGNIIGERIKLFFVEYEDGKYNN